MGTTTVPFQIEFNSSEALFGVEKMYLRNHLLDPTYMRDWATNRMLARFGLPYLRARMIRLYINQDYIGFYTAVEAVDQEYVFARSFPNYDPSNYAMYKWKTDAIGCGRYDPDVLADAEARLSDDFNPPYSFESGSHRPTPPIYGKSGFSILYGSVLER
jgi:CotH kinase protein